MCSNMGSNAVNMCVCTSASTHFTHDMIDTVILSNCRQSVCSCT